MIDSDRKSDPHPPTMGEMARLVVDLKAAGEPITLSIDGRGKLAVGGDATIRQPFELVDQLESTAVLDERLRTSDGVRKGISLEGLKSEMHQKRSFPT